MNENDVTRQSTRTNKGQSASIRNDGPLSPGIILKQRAPLPGALCEVCEKPASVEGSIAGSYHILCAFHALEAYTKAKGQVSK